MPAARKRGKTKQCCQSMIPIMLKWLDTNMSFRFPVLVSDSQILRLRNHCNQHLAAVLKRSSLVPLIHLSSSTRLLVFSSNQFIILLTLFSQKPHFSLMCNMEFTISEWTSSKRTCADMERERVDNEAQIKKMRRGLRPQASFNSAWVLQLFTFVSDKQLIFGFWTSDIRHKLPILPEHLSNYSILKEKYPRHGMKNRMSEKNSLKMRKQRALRPSRTVARSWSRWKSVWRSGRPFEHGR